MNIQTVHLNGRFVRLEPLSEGHVPGLALAGKDPSIWRYLPYGEITTEERMGELVRGFLAGAETGRELPFAVMAVESNRPIGCSRFLEIQVGHRKLEIGGTWFGLAYQRTKANAECKYLMLAHAFEDLGCVRVEFKTDARNHRSQQALARIGAVREGVLRNHMILPDGHRRDSVYYSILPVEWPGVKAVLEEKLRKVY